MGEIIVIRTSDPDESIYRAIIDILQERNIQVLHAANLEPSHLILGDIEIFPGRVLYPLLHGPLPWACIQPGAALQCGLGRGL